MANLTGIHPFELSANYVEYQEHTEVRKNNNNNLQDKEQH